MYFIHRPAQKSDLEIGFNHLQERALYNEVSRKDTLQFWNHLLETGSCITVVIEDRGLPKGKRLVVFGLSVFVTDAFVKEARTTLPPFLGLRIMEKWKGGERVFLTPEEIARANAAEGLNLVILHYGLDISRLNPEDAFRAQQMLQQLAVAYHAGYQIKELLNQYYGLEWKKIFDNSGFVLRRDYREFTGTPYIPARLESKLHPHLVGSSFAEALKYPGTRAAYLCCRSIPPRFRFLPAEQEVLRKALMGETDEEIGLSIPVSHWTVKKRWQTLYDRVMKVDPDLLSDLPEAYRAMGGPQKQRRRYLLDYLRNHPEELRPYAPFPASRRRRKNHPGKITVKVDCAFTPKNNNIRLWSKEGQRGNEYEKVNRR